MKKRYILLKDDSTWTKGAIFEEECEDGNQDFILISEEHMKFPSPDSDGSFMGRDAIMKNPSWFKEIEEVVWLTKEQVKKVKKLFKIK